MSARTPPAARATATANPTAPPGAQGPWTLGKGADTAKNHAICSGPIIIATVLGGGYPLGKGWAQHTEDTARLITAAPDLFAALAWIVDQFEHGYTVDQRDAAIESARAALAKARGEA